MLKAGVFLSAEKLHFTMPRLIIFLKGLKERACPPVSVGGQGLLKVFAVYENGILQDLDCISLILTCRIYPFQFTLLIAAFEGSAGKIYRNRKSC